MNHCLMQSSLPYAEYTQSCCLFQAEADLRVAQADFDRQQEITKLLLEGISSTHVCILTLSKC